MHWLYIYYNAYECKVNTSMMKNCEKRFLNVTEHRHHGQSKLILKPVHEIHKVHRVHNFSGPRQTHPVDRERRVRRHHPRLRKPDILNPFQLGNGNFAFGADITGLQTFEAEYNRGLPLATMSHTIWHSQPGKPGHTYAGYPRIECGSRNSRYLEPPNGRNREWAEHLRSNPHRLNLAKLSFHTGTPLTFDRLQDTDQTLDLWEGILHSHFRLDGAPVEVRTAVAGDIDELGIIIQSPLLAAGSLRVRLAFPYGGTAANGNNAVWDAPHKHHTIMDGTRIRRQLDGTEYTVALRISGGRMIRVSEHEFEITASGDRLELGILFDGAGKPLSAAEVLNSSRRAWREFWNSGGCLEFTDGPDETFELERRMVLSEYLTRINCAGIYPPAETGLACNSWSGRFHLEMHWWHAVHFDLWNRPELLRKSMDFYRQILPEAKNLAAEQGYRGARWPKSSGPDGHPVPSPIEPWLIWHLPHPVYYAELFYRRHPNAETLDYFGQIVDETATFLADFLCFDPVAGRYRVGPQVIDAAEIFRDRNSINPTFETSYIQWALETAQIWRERRRLPRDRRVDDILSRYPVPQPFNGHYTAGESAPDTFSAAGKKYSHPMMLGICGMLPGRHCDREVMRRTLHDLLAAWDWRRESWGWDYPLAALTAIRLGEPQTALKILLMDTPANCYLINGHNHQSPDLPCYLPGNGGLLTAAAMLAHCPKPKDWNWRFEDLGQLL